MTRQPSRAQREREAALRLGLGWVMGIGWTNGPVLLVQAADGRRAESIRKEAQRASAMLEAAGSRHSVTGEAVVLFSMCCANGGAARLRRLVADVMSEKRVSGDLFDVSTHEFTSTVLSMAGMHGLPEIDANRRAALIEDEMRRMR